MFDIWQKIEEKGALAVPMKASALPALGWVEVGEEYPELMPEEFRRYDVYSDPQLICESPFVVESVEGVKAYHFKATDPVGGKSIDVWVDPMELAETFGRDNYHTDDGISSFGGILVCSCGIAGCAGIWSQSFHVSEKLIHWSVVYNDDEIDLFFERETYERGVMALLRELLDNHEAFVIPGPDVSISGAFLESFKLNVDEMLTRRSYFRDMWDEIG